MNKKSTSLLKAVLFGTVIASVPLKSNAQDAVRNGSIWNRLEIGYGETFSNASETNYVRIKDPVTNVITGSTTGQSFSYRTGGGYAAVYFPLTYINMHSALVLNTGINFTMSKWDLGNTSLNPDAMVVNTAKEMYFGVPIGVDYVFGGEASFNREDRVTLRGGAGLQPYMSMDKLEQGDVSNTKFGVKPYIKAEIGFFLGFEWKIRGVMVAGSRTLYDMKAGDLSLNNTNYYASYNFTVRPTYTIGLSVFPFSFGWGKE